VQRHVLPALLLVLMAASVGRAEDWARKMFSETSHDFGTVVHGAKVEYRFQFYNPYKETAHVVGVRSSCGCTSPEVSKSELKTFEKSEIIATFNTRSFTGHHAATLTVTFDKPFYSEVQLNVWGDIRGDVNVQPSLVELGTIEQGQPIERKITVTRSGRSDWQILDVRSLNTSYEVEVVDGPRGGGQVSYDLIVRLKKDARPGYLHDQLILVTNDPNLKQFPIEVEGVVKSELNVSPQALTFGSVEVGQKVTKPVIVSGHKAFKVIAVHCDDDAFTFKVPEASARVQIIPVTLAADKPGNLTKRIRIETDLGSNLAVELVAQAQIKAGVPAPEPDAAPSGEATNDGVKSTGKKPNAGKSENPKPKESQATNGTQTSASPADSATDMGSGTDSNAAASADDGTPLNLTGGSQADEPLPQLAGSQLQVIRVNPTRATAPAPAAPTPVIPAPAVPSSAGVAPN
jgi:hypothetical protein